MSELILMAPDQMSELTTASWLDRPALLLRKNLLAINPLTAAEQIAVINSLVSARCGRDCSRTAGRSRPPARRLHGRLRPVPRERGNTPRLPQPHCLRAPPFPQL